MREERAARIAYLAGAATALAICGILLAFAAWRLGSDELVRRSRNVVVPGSGEPDLRLPLLPEALLSELVRLGAVIDNADNPTGASDHDNMLVQPDARRLYALRPNASVDAYMLTTRQPLNLDPPVLYLRSGSAMSPALEEYLRRHARLRYSFNVDARGFRRTVPVVESRRKVLMVGDSVLFGVGIDDEATMASALQSLLGPEVEVVNAGVGEYDAEEVYRTAELLTEQVRYEALVYVACQNDFADDSQRAYLDSARRMLERLATLAPRCDGRVVVFLETAMEHTLHDVLQGAGWSAQQNALIEALRASLPPIAERLGFAYVDWAEAVAPVSKQDGTLFGRFGLYADRVHLSPRGNRLAAAEVRRALARWGTAAR